MKKMTICCFISALMMAACGGSENKAQQSASAAKPASTSSPSAQKIYKVAIEREFAPFIVPTDRGGISGFEYDVLQAIAKKQGFQVQFDVYPWNIVFAQLESGAADIAGSGIVITEERMKKWDFSEPFIQTNYIAVVPNDSTAQGLEDLKGHKIAVQAYSNFEEFAKSRNLQTVVANSPWLSIKEVMLKHVDGAIENGVIGSYYLQKYPKENLKIIPLGTDMINLGFAVKKGNTELQRKLNDGLAQIKSDGTYNQLKNKWSIN